MPLPEQIPEAVRQAMLRLRDSKRYEQLAPPEVRQVFSKYLGDQDTDINSASGPFEGMFTFGQNEKFAPQRTNILGHATRPGAGVRSMLHGQGFMEGFTKPSQAPSFAEDQIEMANIEEKPLNAMDKFGIGVQAAAGSLADAAVDPASYLPIPFVNAIGGQIVKHLPAFMKVPISDLLRGGVKNVAEHPFMADLDAAANPAKPVPQPQTALPAPEQPLMLENLGLRSPSPVEPMGAPVNPVAEPFNLGPQAAPVKPLAPDQQRLIRQRQRIDKLRKEGTGAKLRTPEPQIKQPVPEVPVEERFRQPVFLKEPKPMVPAEPGLIPELPAAKAPAPSAIPGMPVEEALHPYKVEFIPGAPGSPIPAPKAKPAGLFSQEAKPKASIKQAKKAQVVEEPSPLPGVKGEMVPPKNSKRLPERDPKKPIIDNRSQAEKDRDYERYVEMFSDDVEDAIPAKGKSPIPGVEAPANAPLDLFNIEPKAPKLSRAKAKMKVTSEKLVESRVAEAGVARKELQALSAQAKKMREEGDLLGAVDVERKISTLNNKILKLEGKSKPSETALPKTGTVEAQNAKVKQAGNPKKNLKQRFIDDLNDVLNDEGGWVDNTGNAKKKNKVAWIRKNLKAVETEGKKRGLSFEDALKRFKNEEGKPAFSQDEITKIVKGFLSPAKSDEGFTVGAIVKSNRKGEKGEVVKVTDDQVHVKFDTDAGEGVAKYTTRAAKKILTPIKKGEPLEDIFPDGQKAAPRKITSKDPRLQAQVAAANDYLQAVYRGDKGINPDSALGLVKNVSELVESGDLTLNEVKSLLSTNNDSVAKLVERIREGSKLGGRELNVWSQTQRELNKLFKGDLEYEKAMLHPSSDDPQIYGHLYAASKAAGSFYRQMLTTLWQNAQRNLLTASVRSGWDLLVEVEKGMFEALTKSGLKGQEFTMAKTQAREFIKNYLNMGNELKRKFLKGTDRNYNATQAILKEFPFDTIRLLDPSAVDSVITNKLARALNAFNYAQERFMARGTFSGRLLGHLERSGRVRQNMFDITKDDIAFLKANPDMVKDSVLHSLDMTMGAMPHTEWLKKLVTQVNTWGGVEFVNPFLRFQAWSAEFTARHNPVVFTRLMEKGFREKSFSIGGDKQRKALAEAASGILIFGMAEQTLEKMRGGKYYEVIVGGKTYDLRGIAPILVPQMFMIEAFRNMVGGMMKGKKPWGNRELTNFTAQDWAEGLVGVRKLTGTPLALDQFFRTLDAADSDSDKWGTLWKSMGGQVLAGYFTFFRNMSDVYSLMDPEEAYSRTVKENPFLGPTMAKIPELSQRLPKTATMTEGTEPAKKDTKQFLATGFRPATKTKFENEVDRLGMYLTSKASTGKGTIADAKANRKIMEDVGPWVKREGAWLTNLPEYKNAPDSEKKTMIEGIKEYLLSEYKKQNVQSYGKMVNDELWKNKQREGLKRYIVNRLKQQNQAK